MQPKWWSEQDDGKVEDFEQKTEVKTYAVTLSCPVCKDGEMKFNGYTWPANPEGYHHTCNKCGVTKAIRSRKYPMARYE